jgi:hypothetical protein
MIEPVTRSADGKTFTLAINGKQHSYAHDKEGKRQAILNSLNAIPAITAGEDTYLPDDAALQVVAAVMYPAGVGRSATGRRKQYPALPGNHPDGVTGESD